jgi:two-component system, NtrC family, response regulator
MKSNSKITISVIDPGGYSRKWRVSEFPFSLGTVPGPTGLRDSGLLPDALEIHACADGFRLVAIQPNLWIEVGDVKARDLQLPIGVRFRVKDTELRFDPHVSSAGAPAAESPQSSQSAWLTASHSGYALLESVRKSASSRLSIYLEGETGTGKEVLAQQIHQWSPRAGGRFVAINCGALPVSLAESELFGHIKGAFTGAVRDRPGALLQAHQGTLFLDEVGDLPLEIQVKLLRFLESGEIRPVGSDRASVSDVRVICATHKPLQQLVKEGRFRQDLYFRIASIPLTIPNLRSRPADIDLLAVRFAETQGKSLTEAAQLRLKQYPWPGNVRELRHAVERACGLAGTEVPLLQTQDFGFLNSDAELELPLESMTQDCLDLKTMERQLLLRALKVESGNRSRAAERMGVARSTLFEMMKRHGVVGPRTAFHGTAFQSTV